MELVGHIGVDSGQMMLIDPCYVTKDFETEYPDPSAGPLSYAAACEVTLGEDQAGVLDGSAVVVQSGYGDGNYPVYIERNRDGVISKLIIEFAPESGIFEDEECGTCGESIDNCICGQCPLCDSYDCVDEECAEVAVAA